MAADLEPPELQRLVDFAERARDEDWSLRSALVRYAQPQPERASTVLSLIRRVDAAVAERSRVLRRRGEQVWTAFSAGTRPDDENLIPLVGLLAAAAMLDDLGDRLGEWAADRSRDRPDAEVDAVSTDVARRLDALGVPAEEPPPRPSRAGS